MGRAIGELSGGTPDLGSRPNRSSLRAKLTLLFILLALVPITIGGLVTGIGARREVRAQVLHRMDAVAASASDTLQNTAAGWLSRMRVRTDDLYIRQVVERYVLDRRAGRAHPATQDAVRWFMQFMGAPMGQPMANATLVDLDSGQMLAWSAPLSRAEASLDLHYTPAQLRRCADPWLSDPHRGHRDQTPVVHIVRAIPSIESRTRPPLAALILTIPLPKAIYSALDASPGLGRTGEIVLADQTGLIIKDLRYEPSSAFRSVLTTQPVQRALRGEIGADILADYRGRAVVAGYRQVPLLKWAVVAKIDKSEAEAAFNHLMGVWLALQAVVILLSIMLARLVAEAVADPVREVAEAAGKFASGDLTARAPVTRTDEIGALANGFNAMANQVEARQYELDNRALQLEALNHELESFAYSVSHDLRAPLRAIDGFSNVVLEDYGDRLDEEGRAHLQRARAAAQRMGELIDDLLLLSRLTRQEMAHEAVNLSELAEEIIGHMRTRDLFRTVQNLVAPNLVARGDRRLLQALLANLLENAWKFTGRALDAQIEFGSLEQDGETVYFVRDNGAGFDMTYVHKLFVPFQRLHAMTDFPGNGVGLATVQRVVNRHGGRVWGEGQVGQGATFYFTLES
jgi:signal transduction histidine kinase